MKNKPNSGHFENCWIPEEVNQLGLKPQKRGILEEARRVVDERGVVYGPPLPNHERIARLWTARLWEKLTERITPEEVTSLMRLAKEARLIETPGHFDSLVDLAGYAEAEDQIHRSRGSREA